MLVVGGVATGHTPLETAELYDPKTGTFSPTGSLRTAHAFGAVADLPGGGFLWPAARTAQGRLPPPSGTTPRPAPGPQPGG